MKKESAGQLLHGRTQSQIIVGECIEMILVRVGFLVATTYAATRIGFHYWKSFTSLIKPSDTTEESFKHCNDEERKEEKKVEEKENEAEYLRCVVNKMEETQETNERKLLVYYGLEQQEMEILEFNKELKMKTIEIDKLSKKILLLKFDNMKLQKEVRECDLIKKQLEEARMKIKELQKRIQSNARSDQLKLIEEQVTNFQADAEQMSEVEIQKKLKAREELELKAMHLKRRQKELQLEERVLAIKLVITEARLTSFSNTTEIEIVKKIRKEVDALRTANEELLKQVERLQDNKFSVVEELVYQRWVNTCLRHEVQSCQTPSNNTSTSTRLRQFSAPTNEFYNTTEDDPRSGKTKVGRKTSLLHKFKRWRRSMDNYTLFDSSPRGTTSSESSMSRRSSISTSSLEGSAIRKARDRIAILTSEKKNATCSPETTSVPHRRRRVSFNDSLNTIAVLPVSTPIDITDDMYVEYRDLGKIVLEMESRNKEKASELRTADGFNDGSNITSSFKTRAEMSEKGENLTPQLRLTSIEENIDESKATPNMVLEHETNHIEESATRSPPSPDNNTCDVQSKGLHFEAVFMFFLVLVLLYFWLRSFMPF